MACAICKLPLEDHQSALRVLGELPLNTVKSVLKHQWRKDITRLIYAHAEHYHDQMLFEYPPSHEEQLHYIEADIKRHRSKYIMHYLHAIVEVYRYEEIGATRVTMEDEILIRKELYASQVPCHIHALVPNLVIIIIPPKHNQTRTREIHSHTK